MNEKELTDKIKERMGGKELAVLSGILLYTQKAQDYCQGNFNHCDAMVKFEMESSVEICEIAGYGTDSFEYACNIEFDGIKKETLEQILRDIT